MHLDWWSMGTVNSPKSEAELLFAIFERRTNMRQVPADWPNMPDRLMLAR
jgi:hypothetical protein